MTVTWSSGNVSVTSREELGRLGHEFARLDHHAVARREGAGEWREREVHGVVPRRDDADDPERLRHDLGVRGRGEPADGAGLDLHPLVEVGAAVLDGLDGREDLGEEGLVLAAVAEVAADGFDDVLLMYEDALEELVEALDALLVARGPCLALGLLHAGEGFA